MTLIRKLQTFRRARGLSQSQAARALGVNVATLRNWEQGRNAPRGLALEALHSKLKPSK